MVFSSILALLEIIGEITGHIVPAFATEDIATLRILGFFVVFLLVSFFGLLVASVADSVKAREKEKLAQAIRIFSGKD